MSRYKIERTKVLIQYIITTQYKSQVLSEVMHRYKIERTKILIQELIA